MLRYKLCMDIKEPTDKEILKQSIEEVIELMESGATVDALFLLKELQKRILLKRLPTPHNNQQYLSPEQCGQALNIKSRKVYALIKEKKLIAFRIGRVFRISSAELDRFCRFLYDEALSVDAQ